MTAITRPTVIALLLLFVLTPTFAQQKRQTPPKPQPKVAPTPPPTFDTLVPAESYTIYGEVRGVGSVIRSSAVTEALEPILKLSGPPKEFKTIVKWLQNHADELMTSRLLVATWPIDKALPEAIIAIEFATPEEAAKFATPLNTVLTNVVPKVTETVPKSPGGENAETTEVSKPGYHLQQAGSLIVLTPKPITLKKLKPAGSKSLTEDANFRTARNRFTSEPVFVFVNVKLIERQEEESRKRYEESQKLLAEQAKKEQEAAQQEEKKQEEVPEPTGEDHLTVTEIVKEGPTLAVGTADVPPDQLLSSLSFIGSLFFSGESKWPDGVGLALALENDSIDLRALFVNEPGEKSDLVPFVPTLIPGPPIIPESPNILPADSQLVATMSLDLPQIYAAMTKPTPRQVYQTSRGDDLTVNEVQAFESPFALLEKKLKLNLKDDVLPLLGSEISLRLPITGLDLFGLPRAPSSGEPAGKENQPAADISPLLLIQLRDKEAVRALMPKIVEAVGFKGASSFAQTERKEDTEIVSYANLFSYAFVGNFLVLSTDSPTIRKVVDSYLKHETLASDGHFRNSTRWQPRPAYGQLYISPALMESYKTWAEHTKQLSDATRPVLVRLASVAQPVTYALSNEGLGPLHELHLPKNLVLMAVAGISGESNPTPTRQNEMAAVSGMYMIAYMQEQYKKGKGAGSYGTLEQLIETKMVPKEMLGDGYKFEVVVTGDKFEVFAVPTEYGKTGTFSYFIDQTRVLRGADRGGASANSSDPPIR